MCRVHMQLNMVQNNNVITVIHNIWQLHKHNISLIVRQLSEQFRLHKSTGIVNFTVYISGTNNFMFLFIEYASNAGQHKIH